VPSRYTLTPSDLLIRGCEKERPERLLLSMREHHANPATKGEWGLSVAASPGADEAALLKTARQIRQSHYRVTVVADLRRLRTDPLPKPSDPAWHTMVLLYAQWDHNAHGLIVSRNEPTLEVAAAIAALFGPPKVNPYYHERSRDRARR
jgi:hypothetical protein